MAEVSWDGAGLMELLQTKHKSKGEQQIPRSAAQRGEVQPQHLAGSALQL